MKSGFFGGENGDLLTPEARKRLLDADLATTIEAERRIHTPLHPERKG
jgi:hypothetical protein